MSKANYVDFIWRKAYVSSGSVGTIDDSYNAIKGIIKSIEQLEESYALSKVLRLSCLNIK